MDEWSGAEVVVTCRELVAGWRQGLREAGKSVAAESWQTQADCTATNMSIHTGTAGTSELAPPLAFQTPLDSYNRL